MNSAALAEAADVAQEPMADVAYIALGSNVGDREEYLAAARRAIASIPDVTMLAESEVEETAPIGPVGQDAFLNQMIAVRTELDPRALLFQLQRIEREGGRVRDVRWGPRTIDLDIVKFEIAEYSDAELVVPHPEIVNRPFWQRELAELREATQLAKRQALQVRGNASE